MSYLQTVVVGNLGQDAELTEVGTDKTPKARFSVAANVGYGNNTRTEWVACEMWGQRAASLAPHLTKGQRIIVTGERRTQEWEKDGETRSHVVVRVNEVQFRSLNVVQAAGNLGQTPRLDYLGEKGTPKLSFSVAVNTGYGDYEHTEWFNVVIFGKRAEALSTMLDKGAPVFVTGELRTHSWEGEDGQTHYRSEIVIAPYQGDIVLLGKKSPASDEEEFVLDL